MRKTTVRKTTTRKPAAKKTSARKTMARKPAAKKTTAKKPSAKKTMARKPAAKKTTAKKTAARKSPAKKTMAKKPMTKKTAARKPSAKSAATRTGPPSRGSNAATSGRRGDRIIIDSPQVGSPPREGEVLQVVRGEVNVSYLVRWADGHQTLIAPLSGAARFVSTRIKR
jgi:hypothetical protein